MVVNLDPTKFSGKCTQLIYYENSTFLNDCSNIRVSMFEDHTADADTIMRTPLSEIKGNNLKHNDWYLYDC